jgi:hypothetical protein
MQVNYIADRCSVNVLADLGRTEDIKFSTSNHRLVIPSFLKNKIAVFEVDITAAPGKIMISDAFEISSPYLKRPHGVDFIDDEQIIVANREGDVTIFELPSGGGGRSYELMPLEVIPADDVLKTPGSVSILKKDKGHYEALVCNNFSNHLTKHVINFNERYSTNSEILLRKWISVPDGVAARQGWIAVSNHNCHNVLVYENNGSLAEFSGPDGVLRCVRYPHGLRFTSDGRFILVADAGAPYVHIYRRDALGWRGVRNPVKSHRVLKEEDFLRGHTTVYDGGAKGIDIDNSMRIFATTCEVQPLAFFDLAKILEEVSLQGVPSLPGAAGALDAKQRAFEVNYELDSSPHVSEDDLKYQLARIKSSRSWRLTAPYRWLGSLVRKPWVG